VKRIRTFHFQASLQRVAILSGDTLAALGPGPEAVLSDNWDLPQRLGAVGSRMGLSAILVPSARHGSGNLILFPRNLRRGDRLDQMPE
jgi:hypothetical protein